MEKPGKEGTVKELVGQLGEEVLGKKTVETKGGEQDLVAAKGENTGEEEKVRARRAKKGVD